MNNCFMVEDKYYQRWLNGELVFYRKTKALVDKSEAERYFNKLNTKAPFSTLFWSYEDKMIKILNKNKVEEFIGYLTKRIEEEEIKKCTTQQHLK